MINAGTYHQVFLVLVHSRAEYICEVIGGIINWGFSSSLKMGVLQIGWLVGWLEDCAVDF